MYNILKLLNYLQLFTIIHGLEVLERKDESDLSMARQKARLLYKSCLDVGKWDRIKDRIKNAVVRTALVDYFKHYLSTTTKK